MQTSTATRRSWYCPGQYPPAIKALINRRRNFAQLGDFNSKKDAKDDEYQRQYMARMPVGSKSGVLRQLKLPLKIFPEKNAQRHQKSSPQNRDFARK